MYHVLFDTASFYCFLSQTMLHLRHKKKSHQRVLALGSSQMTKEFEIA